MARRNRDLAGLAALGALGYMATRGGAGRGVGEGRKESVESETRRQTPARDEDDRDIGMISGASPSGLYRNTETGDIFSMNRPEPVRSMTPDSPASATSSSRSKVPEEVPSRGRREMPARRNVAGDYTRAKGATAEEIAAYRNREITPPPMTPEMRKKAEEQALERVTPEEYLIGGPGLKAMHAAAKNLARPRQLLLPAPAARPPVRGTGEGFVMYKKGGAVKAKKMASGGSTSSASSRADGIASRGKTKCKMY